MERFYSPPLHTPGQVIDSPTVRWGDSIARVIAAPDPAPQPSAQLVNIDGLVPQVWTLSWSVDLQTPGIADVSLEVSLGVGSARIVRMIAVTAGVSASGTIRDLSARTINARAFILGLGAGSVIVSASLSPAFPLPAFLGTQ